MKGVMLMASYFAVFRPVPEGGYAVEFPDIVEAFTQGDTIEECVLMGEDVLALVVEEYAKNRRELPMPSSLEEINTWIAEQKNDPDIVPDGRPFIQLFKAPDVNMTPVRVTISMAKSVLDEIDAKAKRGGYTRSGFLAHAAQEYRV